MGWLRRPRTAQERRANGKRNFLEIDGYKIKIRSKRNYANLVDSWDDIHNMSHLHNSWKCHRKHQWRIKDD